MVLGGCKDGDGVFVDEVNNASVDKETGVIDVGRRICHHWWSSRSGGHGCGWLGHHRGKREKWIESRGRK